MDDSGKVFAKCPSCGQRLRVPLTDSTLMVKCPKCSSHFEYTYKQTRKPFNKNDRPGFRWNWKQWSTILVIALFLIVFLWQLSVKNTTEKAISPLRIPANWITISYGSLIDHSAITHSGDTVGEVIGMLKAQDNSGRYKALLQPYLEPYSILCQEYLSAETLTVPPLKNILDHYPADSERPAWTDLSREGHFQIYYNANLIRVFLKGANPETSIEKYSSVIRHPVRDILHSNGLSIENVEVYVFTNDYVKAKIMLNTIPRNYHISELNLSAKRTSPDLDSIESLLNQGVVLEAVEVDRQNNLFFYGKKSHFSTIANQPVSISDVAVIYRAIFHHGNNAPYISLDQHEDNRYAKVNFGGLLENTRVGQVVLEADKLFKTLSTGIDLTSGKQMKAVITKGVPGFLTQDERSLLAYHSDERAIQIRYWFYPDHIGTVTDKSIGAVKTYQFLADAERMDVKILLDRAIRDTIDHLNNNYTQYSKVMPIYRELGYVGRIMALVIWLKEMNIDDRVELEDLLSVMLPAEYTPKKTKKMMALTAAVYPGDVSLRSNNISNYTITYNLSHLVDRYPSTTKDMKFLRIAHDYYDNIDNSDAYPPQYKNLKSKADRYSRLIDVNQIKLNGLKQELDEMENRLNIKSHRDMNHFNELVTIYNHILTEQRARIGDYNQIVNQLNQMKIKTQIIASIGGGISLNPREFRRVEINPDSARIKMVTEVKRKLKPVGRTAIHGEWVRNNPVKGAARINRLP